MRITGVGSFPLNHIAKAYGIKQTAIAKPLLQPPAIESAPASSAHSSAAIDKLIAAKVATPVNFDSVPPIQAGHGGVFQMYTRAADKIEAAVAVQIGRALDVKG